MFELRQHNFQPPKLDQFLISSFLFLFFFTFSFCVLSHSYISKHATMTRRGKMNYVCFSEIIRKQKMLVTEVSDYYIIKKLIFQSFHCVQQVKNPTVVSWVTAEAQLLSWARYSALEDPGWSQLCCNFSLDSISGPGTSICHRCSNEKQKIYKKKVISPAERKTCKCFCKCFL